MALPAIALVSAIATLAPKLARVFGAGDVTQEVADKAASIAQVLTGASDNSRALEVLASDPEKLAAYQEAVLKNKADFEGLYVQDKESARLRDVEFLKAGTRNYRADFLVGVSVVGLFTILGIVTLAPSLSEFGKGALTTILGVLLGWLTNVFNFEFGTTRKSEDAQSKITEEYIRKP